MSNIEGFDTVRCCENCQDGDIQPYGDGIYCTEYKEWVTPDGKCPKYS